MKKICLVGGGHGTSRLIKGFINKDVKIDVIVTSSDNGGHSGELTKEFNVPALGDLRMVLESLLNKPLVDVFSYRFKKLHNQNNVSLGNLILLSLVLENGSVNKMLEIVNNLVDSKFKLHLANSEYVELIAKTSSNKIIKGEVNIGECSEISELYLQREGVVEQEVIEALLNADIIVFSFGSFYTSLGAVIVSEKIKKAIKESKAKLVYIPNLVNQKETKDYYLEDYVDFLENTIKRKLDCVLVSNSKIKRKYIKRYRSVGKEIVTLKQRRDNYQYYPLLVIEEEKLRHNFAYLGKIITGE